MIRISGQLLCKRIAAAVEAYHPSILFQACCFLMHAAMHLQLEMQDCHRWGLQLQSGS